MINTTKMTKMFKYEIKHRVAGRLEASHDIFEGEYSSMDLDSEKMAKLYDSRYELEEFMEENSENLIEFADSRVPKCVKEANFGKLAILEGYLNHITTIISEEELDCTEIQEIVDWVEGQLSDGWGEGLEQRPFNTQKYDYTWSVFDEYDFEAIEDSEYGEIDYYLIPRNRNCTGKVSHIQEVEEEKHLGEIVTSLVIKTQSSEFPINTFEIYELDGWNNFVEFTKLNDVTCFVDTGEFEHIDNEGKLYLIAEHDDLMNSPTAYTNLEGIIVVERLGGRDYYPNFREFQRAMINNIL